MPKGLRGWSLLDKLLYNIRINEQTDCWEWQGGTNNIGYGMIRDDKRMRTTHRVSYEEHNNTKIPKYMCVCHSCDNPLCVNPQHLWLGTRKDNIQDMIKKGRGKQYGMTPGRKLLRVKCEHCNIDFGINMHKRWHGDKCKHKP